MKTVLGLAAVLSLLIAGVSGAQEVAVDPHPSPPNPAVLTTVMWLERPSAADFARYYPRPALRSRIEGRAVLDCTVDAEGLLSCTVATEDPEGQGFGEAALSLSRHFRMAQQTRDGRPTEGGRARVPITFRLQ
jgi:protein TonB